MYVWTTKLHAIFTCALNAVFLGHIEIKFNFDDEHKKLFYELFIPELIIAIYGAIVTMLLLSLSVYHSHLILMNNTTQEEMRDKYSIWGSNPYSRTSRQNCLYFLKQHASIVFETTPELTTDGFNQHVADKELIYSLEVSDEVDAASKMSNSHIDLREDIKSMKSYKSRGSIKSEIMLHQEVRKKFVNTIQHQNEDESDEESSSHRSESNKEAADIISHKSYKSIKSH